MAPETRRFVPALDSPIPPVTISASTPPNEIYEPARKPKTASRCHFKDALTSAAFSVLVTMSLGVLKFSPVALAPPILGAGKGWGGASTQISYSRISTLAQTFQPRGILANQTTIPSSLHCSVNVVFCYK
eukprot:42917-Prorocentrum_minimum.AAC.2